MHATIAELRAWLENPDPGAEQIVNGRTPYDRVSHLLTQAERRVRGQQLRVYETNRERDRQMIAMSCEVLDELEHAVEDLRRRLRRGTTDPTKVMQQVAESMRGLRDLAVDAEAIQANAVSAAEMVDTDPADFEQQRLQRFSAVRSPVVTAAFLRGEESSPFEDLP